MIEIEVEKIILMQYGSGGSGRGAIFIHYFICGSIVQTLGSAHADLKHDAMLRTLLTGVYKML